MFVGLSFLPVHDEMIELTVGRKCAGFFFFFPYCWGLIVSKHLGTKAPSAWNQTWGLLAPEVSEFVNI